MDTTTVMFVPNTRYGILLKKLKDKEEILSRLCGFRVKYTEAAGTQLGKLFSQDLGKGKHCGREVCPPCDNSEEGKRQNCRTRSILYETYCSLCNSDKKDDHSSQQGAKEGPIQPPGRQDDEPKVGYYIGESSRSFHERMSEHLMDAKKFLPESHILKH